MTNPAGNHEKPIKAIARRAGILYIVMSALMVWGYMYVPATFMVSGDAAATARRIADGEQMYRLSILVSLVAQFMFVVVVLTLYNLFRDVHRGQARLMVTLVCLGVAAELVTIANRMTPLLLLGGADYLSAFTRPQLEALAMGSMRWGGNLGRFLTSIWGLWLFPFGFLTIRSGYFPKVLGVLLLVAGVGYVATCATFIAFPAQLQAVSRVMMPLYFGELPIIFWLAIAGARAPRRQA